MILEPLQTRGTICCSEAEKTAWAWLRGKYSKGSSSSVHTVVAA